MANRTFTSESVSEGHPDKMADQISDAVLDAILAKDKDARVACETLVKTGMVILAGEITTDAQIDFEEICRQVVLDIGYNSSDVGFDGATCAILNALGKQSPDIAMGVDEAADHEQGAGDQGLMFGYATNETDVLMPAPIDFSHRLVKRQADVRKSGLLSFLRPDAKSQVSFSYDDKGNQKNNAVITYYEDDDTVIERTELPFKAIIHILDEKNYAEVNFGSTIFPITENRFFTNYLQEDDEILSGRLDTRNPNQEIKGGTDRGPEGAGWIITLDNNQLSLFAGAYVIEFVENCRWNNINMKDLEE